MITTEKEMNTQTWTTQIEAARLNIITPAMREAADYEQCDPELIRQGLAEGTIVIPANKNHRSIKPRAVGTGIKTKVNVNLGISKDCADRELEMDKARAALDLGADSIMDLSCYGETRIFRKALLEETPLMVGTVPMYDAVGNRKKGLKELDKDDFMAVVRDHGEDGVDFMTIHAGINRQTAERLKRNPRLAGIVSRGGSLLFAWMEMTGKENPFYEHYDELLEICKEYDVTLSLGDSCRPGCNEDATDASQIEELITLGELVLRAREAGVQVMVEGPGHMKMDEIEANVVLAKKLCHRAPFYVLGPLVTDITPGYDHITGAIGGAIAARAGADFLCYLTPAEHLRLPNLEDVKEGIMASRIAAHAADLVKNPRRFEPHDRQMSYARKQLDWESMFNLAMDPVKARQYRSEAPPAEDDSCSMCGEMCAVKNMNTILKGKTVDINPEL
ncbi:MAG: phosphomethylpyrimidine synthase ThiC [Spirochaetales bacterium]|nr:phosphomethylpyrimidine synthase ThiC [Spirochaetales bacterium]